MGKGFDTNFALKFNYGSRDCIYTVKLLPLKLGVNFCLQAPRKKTGNFFLFRSRRGRPLVIWTLRVDSYITLNLSKSVTNWLIRGR